MIKLGPNQTGKTGIINCIADLPGLVTLTASDPACVLTPSSFTVGGTVDSWVDANGCTRGLSALTDAAAWAMAKRRNFAIGIEINFFAGMTGNYGALGLTGLYNGEVSTYEYAFNWGISCAPATRKIGYYFSNAAGSGAFTGNFAKVFTAGAKTRAVLVFLNDAVVLYVSTGAESVAHAAINTDTPRSSSTTTVCRVPCTYQRFPRLTNFQFYNGVPSGDHTTGEIAAYLAGGDLGAAQVCKLKISEESGLICYDHSGNGYDFGPEPVNARTTYFPQVLSSGLEHTVTGLTGNEQSISYDTTTIAPGTAITITATRVKAGFPTGRTPDISVELDTCTVTAAAAPGSLVVGVSLDKTDIVIEKDEEIQLNATVFPSTATNKALTWVSDHSGIVSVSASGKLKGITRGNFEITVETDDGGFTAVCSGFCNADPIYGEIVENTMSDLLPQCLENDLVSRSLMDTLEERFQDSSTGLVPLMELLKIYNIADDSTDILDFVADSFNVFGWQKGANITQKRAFLIKILEIQRKIGTKWAVYKAIELVVPSSLNEGISIIEGTGGIFYDGSWDYDGSEYFDSQYHWAKFDVIITSSIGSDLEPYRKAIESVIDHYKPVRCVLRELTFSYTA